MIVVETGAVVAGADSYVAVADADTYHANRGNDPWASLSTSLKEAALRKATAFIDGAYRLRWKGRRVNPIIQPLEFPRTGVTVPGITSGHGFAAFDGGFGGDIFYPFDHIPQRVKDAVCEAALKSTVANLVPDQTRGVVREKIGEIETEYDRTSASGSKSYTVIENLLSDFLKSTSSVDLYRG
jgi:hypothetical protein